MERMKPPTSFYRNLVFYADAKCTFAIILGINLSTILERYTRNINVMTILVRIIFHANHPLFQRFFSDESEKLLKKADKYAIIIKLSE